MTTVSTMILHQLIEAKIMALKPKPKLKGIPVGSFDAIADAAGKMKIKPKKKHKTLQQQYASKNKRRFKAAK